MPHFTARPCVLGSALAAARGTARGTAGKRTAAHDERTRGRLQRVGGVNGRRYEDAGRAITRAAETSDLPSHRVQKTPCRAGCFTRQRRPSPGSIALQQAQSARLVLNIISTPPTLTCCPPCRLSSSAFEPPVVCDPAIRHAAAGIRGLDERYIAKLASIYSKGTFTANATPAHPPTAAPPSRRRPRRRTRAPARTRRTPSACRTYAAAPAPRRRAQTAAAAGGPPAWAARACRAPSRAPSSGAARPTSGRRRARGCASTRRGQSRGAAPPPYSPPAMRAVSGSQ